MPFHAEETNTTHAIQDAIAGRDDLLNDEPPTEHPLGGHCYVASEVLFHLTDGYEQWYVERTKVRVEGDWFTHWYLRERETGQVVDLTAAQFTDFGITIPYGKGTRTGFLTSEPSERAQEIIDTLK